MVAVAVSIKPDGVTNVTEHCNVSNVLAGWLVYAFNWFTVFVDWRASGAHDVLYIRTDFGFVVVHQRSAWLQWQCARDQGHVSVGDVQQWIVEFNVSQDGVTQVSNFETEGHCGACNARCKLATWALNACIVTKINRLLNSDV